MWLQQTSKERIFMPNREFLPLLNSLMSSKMSYAKLTWNKKNISYEGKRKVLCMMLQKVLCRTLAAFIFGHTFLTNTLLGNGCKLNPCDLCASNRTSQVKCSIIIHHDDDTKMSHVNHKVVDSIINLLESHFGKIKVTQGKEHEFVSMKIAQRKL